MLNTYEKIVEGLLNKGGFIEQYIYETEAHLKRDLTIDEEMAYVKECTQECIEWARMFSCSLTEAFNDMYY